MILGNFSDRKRLRKKLLYTLILCFGLCLAGISLTRYATILPLIKGLVAGFFILCTYLNKNKVAELFRRLLRFWKLMLIILISFFVVIVISKGLNSPSRYDGNTNSPNQNPNIVRKTPLSITRLNITIQIDKDNKDKFQIVERGMFNCSEFSDYDFKNYLSLCNTAYESSDQSEAIATFELPARVVTAETQGFFLKEVSIRSDVANHSGKRTLVLSNGESINDMRSPLCRSNSCPEEIKIEVQDLPSRSFYAAQDVSKLDISPYFQTDTIRWEAGSLRRNVAFVYIPSPFHHFSLILKPFISISSLSQWLLTLSTTIFTIVAVPMLVEIAREKLKRTVVAKEPKPKRVVRLVISSRGDEKEVEIDN